MTINELKQKKQWINWKYDEIKGKVPYNYMGYPTGVIEKYTKSWCDYETAKKAKEKFNFSGIGIVLFNGLCGIDIDHRSMDDYEVKNIINLMDTYTEFSPSGEGIHLLFTIDISKIPSYIDEKGCKKLDRKYYCKNSNINTECYISDLTSRYFTFTDNAINNKSINERTEQLIEFLNRYMIKQENSNIQKIIENIKKSKYSEKFNKLFYIGDISDYDFDDSRADLALCSIIAFYTKDFNTIDTIFRQSKLYREKWDREDYKERTINNAIKDKNITSIDNIANNKAINELEYITAIDLQKKELSPITYYVQDILPQGLTLVCSTPKMGKSWLALDLCLSICNGTPFLGHTTKKGDCLYLALEDNQHRLKERMNKLLGYNNAPANLIYSIDCNNLANGFINQLENILKEKPSINVIVIDTLQRVRGISKCTSIYAQDYEDLSKIKKFADEHKLCVVVIHHTRKGNDITDIFEKVSGTNGITGTADTTWIIHKKDRFQDETILSVIGRDVEANEYIMEFDKENCKWRMISTIEESEENKQKEKYYNDTIVDVIKMLIDENNGTWSGTINSMNDKHKEIYGYEYEKSPQKIRNRLNNLRSMLLNIDNIQYLPSKYPIGGKRLQTFKKI